MKSIAYDVGTEKTIEELDNLINEMLEWPKWKLQAMCLDESDLEIKNYCEHIYANRKNHIKI